MIVAFVPEGLLPTLSLSLALAVQRMAGENALVKKLSGVETLGAATVICTDKTGTLTTSKIMVVSIYMGGDLLEGHRLRLRPPGAVRAFRRPPASGEAPEPALKSHRLLRRPL
jgi:P-type Ca2+ transporter type 2C